MSDDPKNFDLELVSGNVKAAMKAAGGTSADLWKVPRSHIRRIPGFNVRSTDDPDYKAQVRRIADSIKLEGFYPDKPITGFVSREGNVNVINVTDGHTRLDAVDLAISEGAEVITLPVVVTERGTSMEDLTVRLVTTNSGRQLKPMEVGLVCKRLIGYGMKDSEIASRLGITPRYIDSLLELAGAPRAVRDMVNTGKVSATMAIETLKQDGDKAPEKLKVALDAAQAQGKTKITKKDLLKEPAKAQRAADTQPTRATPLAAANTAPSLPLDVPPCPSGKAAALDAAYQEWERLNSDNRRMFDNWFPEISRHFNEARQAEAKE